MLIVSSQATIVSADDRPFRAAGMRLGSLMSMTNAENFIRIARDQVSQRDINESLLKAIIELMREVKRLDDELHRARRDIQVARRF